MQLDVTQLLLTSITLAASGAILFLVKDVPKRILLFIKTQITTTVYLSSTSQSFYFTLKFLENHYKKKNFRTFKLSNGKYGQDETILSIGYGNHFIRYACEIFHIKLERQESGQSAYDKETITITRLGRNKTKIENFVKDISKNQRDENKITLSELTQYAPNISSIHKRDMSTVFIETNKIDQIITAMRSFLDNEQWYIEHGIPYQIGILLHGNPGTGKSSLIKAIASYFDMDIVYIPVILLYKLNESIELISKSSIIVVEDIDCNSMLHSRKPDAIITSAANSKDQDKITLSEVLNQLDGLTAPHGRILIATTNHIERLDPALVRKGRIDLKIEVGYVNNEIFDQFTNKFFNVKSTNISIKDAITCSDLQDMILRGLTYEQIVDEVRIVGGD